MTTSKTLTKLRRYIRKYGDMCGTNCGHQELVDKTLAYEDRLMQVLEGDLNKAFDAGRNAEKLQRQMDGGIG